MICRPAFILCFCFMNISALTAGCVKQTVKPTDAVPAAFSNRSVIRVNVTRQGYYFHRPWQKRSPSSRTAIGVVLEGRRVLVTAKLVADHRYVELERIETGKKCRAVVEVIDYEANLALLKPSDDCLLEDMVPVGIITDAVEGDQISVWQVKPNGNMTPSHSPITSIEVARYSHGNYFLIYKATSPLQYRFKNQTLPVVKDGKLAGLLMRHHRKDQTIDIIPAPIIEHFVKDADNKPYLGFPTMGIKMESTQDPQLRRYLGIDDSLGGIYVQRVFHNSCAEKAGLQIGDVIVEVAGYPVDSKGNYEHLLYGKVNLSHLIRSVFQVGNELNLKMYREGRFVNTPLVLEHRDSRDYLVPPMIFDRQPNYIILGGLVLQELSLPFLLDYGKRWQLSAPVHLVYYEKHQHELVAENREKIVLLSGVLPNPFTIGYEDLSNLIVRRINDRHIGKLSDVPMALEHPIKGFHKIEFEKAPGVIYLDPREIPSIDRLIQERYNIPVLNHLAD